MARRIPTAARIAPLLLAACGSGAVIRGGGGALSYAQVRSLEKGIAADALLRAFGPPAHALEQDGTVRGLRYRAENAAGEATTLRMVFDDQGRLERWTLGDTPSPEPASE